MNEPVTKPPRPMSQYVKGVGAFSILIVCFMAGFTIASSMRSSEVSKLSGECDRKEKALDNAINQLNIITSAFEKYRKQYPGLNDGQLIEENNKLRKDIETIRSQITALKVEAKDNTNQIAELSKDNNRLQGLINNKDKEVDSLKHKLEQANLEAKKLQDKLKNYNGPNKNTAKVTKKKKVDRVLADDEYICDSCGEVHKKYPGVPWNDFINKQKSPFTNSTD